MAHITKDEVVSSLKHIADRGKSSNDVPLMAYTNGEGELLDKVELPTGSPVWMKAGVVQTITLG